MKYGELKTYTAVRRAFATKFDRYWAPNPINPYVLAECRKTTGYKCMAWTGIVDGKYLPVVLSEGSVNSKVYLKVLVLQLEPLLPGSNTCINRMARPAMLRGHVWIS